VDAKAIAAVAAIAGRPWFKEADFQVDDRLGAVESDDFGLDGDLVAGFQWSAELVEHGCLRAMEIADATTGLCLLPWDGV